MLAKGQTDIVHSGRVMNMLSAERERERARRREGGRQDAMWLRLLHTHTDWEPVCVAIKSILLYFASQTQFAANCLEVFSPSLPLQSCIISLL